MLAVLCPTGFVTHTHHTRTLTRTSTLQVSASSSSASMDQQASEAQPPQPAETAHSESASAKSAGDNATDNISEASDAPASSSFVMPLFQHFPSPSFATDAAREESTSRLDSGLDRDSNASTGSFAGFESAQAKAAHELFCRPSQGSKHASVSSEASTPAMHECTSGKHRSPFIAQKVEHESSDEQQQQGHVQDPGHLRLPSGPRLSFDRGPPQADGGAAGGGNDPYGPPELGRASPRWVPAIVLQKTCLEPLNVLKCKVYVLITRRNCICASIACSMVYSSIRVLKVHNVW